MDGGPSAGPILVQGDHFGGQTLYLEGGAPTFIYDPLGGSDHAVTLRASAPLAAGAHVLAVVFKPAGGQAGTIDLMVDGQSVAQARVERLFRVRGEAYVGRAGGAPFMPGMTMPERCGCEIESVTVEKTGVS